MSKKSDLPKPPGPYLLRNVPSYPVPLFAVTKCHKNGSDDIALFFTLDRAQQYIRLLNSDPHELP